MVKVKSWRPPPGTSASDDHIYPKVKEHAALLVTKPIDYESRDMKTGISVVKLLVYIPLLLALLAIDKRGGYFKQTSVEEALTKLYNEDDHRATILMHALSLKLTLRDHIIDQAYVCRVMLSHLREKATLWMAGKKHEPSKGHPAELIVGYSIIKNHMHTAAYKKTTNKFIHYQTESSEESEDSEAEEVSAPSRAAIRTCERAAPPARGLEQAALAPL